MIRIDVTAAQNKEEEVTIQDLAENSRKVSIKANNIEKTDNTTADASIPKTEKNVIIISLTCVLLVGIVSYIKLKKIFAGGALCIQGLKNP